MSRRFSLDQTTAWIGAFFAVGAIGGALYGIYKYTDKKYVEEQQQIADQKLERFTRVQKELQEKIKKHQADEAGQEEGNKDLTFKAQSSGKWGYSGSLGPAYWSQFSAANKNCDSKSGQSPIDLFGSRLDAKLKPIKIFYGRQQAAVALFNQTVRMAINPGSYVEVNGDPFDLKEIVFRTPSEHHLQGLPYEMEVQLIHRNPRGQTVIVSTLVKAGKHDAVAPFDLPEYEGDQRFLNAFNPDVFIPKVRRYMHYTGSLTDPPCSPKVEWMVYVEPIIMTSKSIDRFVKLQKHNARSLQSLSGRSITRSNR